MRERDIERHLVKRVKELGGEVRKVAWVGRRDAPDRFVMLPPLPAGTVLKETIGPLKMQWRRLTDRPTAIWVEVKNPKTVLTFPANAHERAQHREHERMRRLGQRVEVVGTIEQIEDLLR